MVEIQTKGPLMSGLQADPTPSVSLWRSQIALNDNSFSLIRSPLTREYSNSETVLKVY
jgi:hypothetical protein